MKIPNLKTLGQRELAPEGTHIGSLASVRDLGEKETPWGKQRKLLLTPSAEADGLF